MADPPSPAEMRFGKIDDIKSRVAAAIDASRRYLFSTQNPEEGYWCGELGADTTLVSDYILLHRLLGTEDPVRTQKCANEILNRQNEDGGWPIYNDGPSNISASVKAYFALKMAGYSPEHPQLQKARQRILANGGVTAVNTFTKIYLCTLGQYEYDAVPAVPPELILFPKWWYFNIDEIFVGGRKNADLHLKWDRKRLLGWRNVFLAADRLFHWAERVHIRPLRK